MVGRTYKSGGFKLSKKLKCAQVMDNDSIEWTEKDDLTCVERGESDTGLMKRTGELIPQTSSSMLTNRLIGKNVSKMIYFV